jgi:hypothetical protein
MAKNSNNVLAIGVGLNLDPLNNDIQQAASTAKSGMDTIGSAIVGSSNKSGTATKDLGDKVQSLRTQLRQATQDTQQMAEKFGVMSQQAIASASRAGELKDKIGDINTVITAFSADSKFTVVAGALQQAAGAASIVTGAMGLLGTESKATQEMLLKVQSALALTQGLAQLKEMGAAFTALQAVIVGQVIPSFTSMGLAANVALGVAGIALAAVITAVVMYNNSLDDEAAALAVATKAQKDNNDAIAKSQSIIIDTQNLRTRAMKDGLEKELRLNKDKLATELYENELAYSKGEIGLTSFGLRKIYIQQNFANEEAKIRKTATDKENENAKKASEKLKKTIEAQYSEISQIKNQFAGGGQMSLGTIKAPTMPTKLGLNEEETIAFKLKQQTDAAYDGMIKASLKLQEVNADMWAKLAKIKENGLNSVFGNLGEALGSTIAKSIQGQNVDMFGALRDAVLLSIADMAVAVGTALVAAGVALAIDPMTASMTGAYTKIAAGTALIAAGSLAKGLIKGGSSGSSTAQPTSVAQSSFSQGGNMSSNFLPTQGNTIVINGMIKGNDIQLVNGRNDKKFNRNFNFG